MKKNLLTKNILTCLISLLILGASCSKTEQLSEQSTPLSKEIEAAVKSNSNNSTESNDFKDDINTATIASLSTLQQQLFWTIVTATEVADAQENSFSSWNPYMAVNESLLSTVTLPYSPTTHTLSAWPGEAFPSDLVLAPSHNFANIMDLVPSLNTILTNMEENYANDYTIYIFVNKTSSLDPNSGNPIYDLYIMYAPIRSEPYIPVFEDPYTPPPPAPNPSVNIYFTKGAGDPQITIIYPM